MKRVDGASNGEIIGGLSGFEGKSYDADEDDEDELSDLYSSLGALLG